MMFNRFIKFFLNGTLLGIAAIGIQWMLYRFFMNHTSNGYAVATAITYIPLMGINFMIQKKWVFNAEGIFIKFCLANLTIMAFVSLLSPLCKLLIDFFVYPAWGARLGFFMAALIGSVPSYYLTERWVFRSISAQPLP
jgi:putative flippase GtrA